MITPAHVEQANLAVLVCERAALAGLYLLGLALCLSAAVIVLAVVWKATGKYLRGLT